MEIQVYCGPPIFSIPAVGSIKTKDNINKNAFFLQEVTKPLWKLCQALCRDDQKGEWSMTLPPWGDGRGSVTAAEMNRSSGRAFHPPGVRGQKSMQSFRNQHGFRLLNSWGKLWDNGALSSKLWTRSALQISQKLWAQSWPWHLLAVWPWPSYSTSLGLSFLIYKMSTHSHYRLLQWIVVRRIHVKHLELCLAPSKPLQVSFYH